MNQPSSPSILVPEADGIRTCTMCGKKFERDPILVADADLCPECRKTYGGMAYVFCNTCQKIVTRLKPGLSAKGYLVTPHEILHVPECPGCHPGIVQSMPLEFIEYEKIRGLT